MSKADFDNAYKSVGNLKSNPSNEDKLELYSLGKIANGAKLEGDRPGVFNFEARKKYDAWKEKVDSGITKEEAQKQYVTKFEELKNTIGLK